MDELTNLDRKVEELRWLLGPNPFAAEGLIVDLLGELSRAIQQLRHDAGLA